MTKIKRNRQNKRQELLERLFRHSGRPEVLREVAEYLSQEQDESFLEEVLEAFEKSQPPIDSPDASHIWIVLQPMLHKLLQLTGILDSLSLMKAKDQKNVNFVQRCFQRIVDHWANVTKWLFHLLAVQTAPPSPFDQFTTPIHAVMSMCIKLLCTLVSEIDGNPYKEQLISMPITTDLLLLLLCRTDPKTGRYYDVSRETSDSSNLFRQVWYPASTSTRGRECIIDRISNCSLKQQGAIARAFTSRAQLYTETLDTEAQLNLAMNSLVQLFNTASVLSWAAYDSTGVSIWKLLSRKRFLYEYASALSKVAEKAKELKIEKPAFWAQINQCSTSLTLMGVFAAPNPVDVIPQLIEGGVLPCILENIPYTVHHWPPASHPFVVEPLRMLYPFLYTEKVYAALEVSGGLDLLDAWTGIGKTTPGREICEEWKQLLWRAIYAFDNRREHEELRINMCHNAKCRLHLTKTGMGSLPPKICSACHAVTYCSVSCQTDDWSRFHSTECSGLAQAYNDQRLSGNWTSWRTRRDQLIFLQVVANNNLPDLPTLKLQEASVMKQAFADVAKVRSAPRFDDRPPYASNLALTVVDLVDERTVTVLPGLPVAEMNHSWWPKINGVWDRRIEACVRDMEKNQDSVILLEGKFALDERYTMWVFAKMGWDPTAPKGERYRIVNHAFRLGVSNWSEERTPWLFQKGRQLNDLGNLPAPGSRR